MQELAGSNECMILSDDPVSQVTETMATMENVSCAIAARKNSVMADSKR